MYVITKKKTNTAKNINREVFLSIFFLCLFVNPVVDDETSREDQIGLPFLYV